MFRLIRLGFTLGCLAALFWFGTRVKLGELTLYEHVKAIGQSEPSQHLIEGTKQKVSEGVTGVGRLVGGKETKPAEGRAKSDKATAGKAVAAADEKPSDAVSDGDRKALRKLIESRR